MHCFEPYFVDRDVGILSVDCPEREAALLKLGLGVIPLLVDDELLEAREEADLSEDATKLLKNENVDKLARSYFEN